MNGFLAVTEQIIFVLFQHSVFFSSKQLLFLPICFTVCAIIAKNIGLSDFEINYKADVPGETHAAVQSYCITIEIGLWKTKRKRFQNFRQSCVLLTDRIEIHQSQPTLVAAIGGFRCDLSITRKTDGNFGNVNAGVLFSKVAYRSTKTVVSYAWSQV